MDLCERRGDLINRHPWELSRLDALKSLLKMVPGDKNDFRVLDVGCGDGFVSQELFKDVRVESITGIDTNLSDQQVDTLTNRVKDITYYNNYVDLKIGYYNVTLLLDIIEHIGDAQSFLLDIVNKYVTDGGYILITAPAFQSIYGSHDRFLKHERRYNCKELVGLSNATNLECVSSGYLFVSLLLIRYFLFCSERLLGANVIKNRGVGVWNHGKILTNTLALLLRTDIQCSIALNRVGIKLPGLTVWALCKKLR
jgi:SAM-dependent methyltransferase